MPTYKIDAGNSNSGTIGFVAYVTARNRAGALAKTRNRLGRAEHKVVRNDDLQVLVYFNVDNVSIEEVELDR